MIKKVLVVILVCFLKKGDVTSTDTINRGYVWASTNTTTKSRSGSTSADYNQIIIFGKNNINKSINLGFTFIPEASSKSKYHKLKKSKLLNSPQSANETLKLFP